MDEFYGQKRASTVFYDVIESALRPIASEVACYQKLAQGISTPILEIGCGTGRIAWAMAEAGYSVLGVDASAAMLERAEQKRGQYPETVAGQVSFVLQDACALEMPRSFDLILSPHRVFNHILSSAGQRSFLASVRRHLTKNGRAILDTVCPDIGELQKMLRQGDPHSYQDVVPHLILALPPHGLTLERRGSILRIDPDQQIFEFGIHIALRETESGAVRSECVDRLSYRWLSPDDMSQLLASEGLRLIAQYRDFAETPPESDFGDRVWVIGRA